MARGASRIIADSAGGTLFYTKNRGVIVNSNPAAGEDSLVMPHDIISLDHTPVNVVTTQSNSVFVSGLRAVREDDHASCGHKCTGSKSVFFN